jgi:DNA-binding MarR family transcriptional regulator
MLLVMTDRPANDRQAPDPLALRALAHPLRWKLLDLVLSEQSATATRCAEALGESVASCSYHLGILAKYGYIELDPDRPGGREKPWRATTYEQDLSTEGLDEPGTLAVQAATEAFLDHELARIKDRLRRQDLEPAEWRQAGHLLGSTTFVTADELREIKDQLVEIANRYADRLADPARRPAGAREARIFTVTSVAPRPVEPK